jgi:mercuric ion binding protein
MKSLLVAFALILPALSHADDYSYKVTGMHCGACAKMIKAKVCTMEGIEKCEVEVGSLKFSTKNSVKFTPDQIQEAVSKAGEYKVQQEAK